MSDTGPLGLLFNIYVFLFVNKMKIRFEFLNRFMTLCILMYV